MAYFSFKKIGTLVILPMIVLASITAEAYSAPKVKVLSQSQRGQVFRRSRSINQQLTNNTNQHCYHSPISVESKIEYSQNDAFARFSAKENGIEEWEDKGYAISNVTPQWKFAKDKTIRYEQRTGYPGGVPTSGWIAILKATPCQTYNPGHNIP